MKAAASPVVAPGSSADKFVLNASDGSTWDVKIDKVSLADHVGHTVTAKDTASNVTIHNMKEEAKDAAASAGMKRATINTATWPSTPSRWPASPASNHAV